MEKKILNRYKCGPVMMLIVVMSVLSPGCKKWTAVPAPENSLNAANVYTNDATAAAVLTGIYARMSTNDTYFALFGRVDLSDVALSVLPGLSGDELTLSAGNGPALVPYYTNRITGSTSDAGTSFWPPGYEIIFICNSAVEGLSQSTSLTHEVKQQLLGEAKFMRAFCYFYLVNLYGDVPLVLTTDYKINMALSRAPQDRVYQQIISDLKDAQSLLSNNYLDATVLSTSNQRVRPTKWAATALLARTYLYNKEYANAELNATDVINNNAQFDLVPLNNVFLLNSKEAILQLQPVGRDIRSNTGEGMFFILPAGGPGSANPVYLSSNVVNSFEAGDMRKDNWTGNVTAGGATYYYPFKYKIGFESTTREYMMILRLGEQYLIRAEARAHLNNVSGAVADLNRLRARARGSNAGDLPALSAGLSPQQALEAVAHERQVELFTEMGHRWFDLKRTGKIDEVMNTVATQKGTTWNTNWALYPIPFSEIEKDANLVQNPGYPNN